MFMLPWKERRQALAILRPVRACSAPEHCCSPRCSASTVCRQSAVRGVSWPGPISCSPTRLAWMGADLRRGAWGESVVPRAPACAAAKGVGLYKGWGSNGVCRAQEWCQSISPCLALLSTSHIFGLDTSEACTERSQKRIWKCSSPIKQLARHGFAIWILLIRAKSGITHAPCFLMLWSHPALLSGISIPEDWKPVCTSLGLPVRKMSLNFCKMYLAFQLGDIQKIYLNA